MTTEQKFYLFSFIFTFTFLAFLTETLRFDSPLLNHLALGTAIFIAWFIPPNPFEKTKKIVSISIWAFKLTLLPLLFLIWSLFTLLLMSDLLLKDINNAFKKIETIEINSKTYQVYRTNGGATTAYGIVIRREASLIFGINYVDRVFSDYPAAEIAGYRIEDQKIFFETY